MFRSWTCKNHESFHWVWDPRKQKPVRAGEWAGRGLPKCSEGCSLARWLLPSPPTNLSPGAGLGLGWGCQGKDSWHVWQERAWTRQPRCLQGCWCNCPPEPCWHGARSSSWAGAQLRALCEVWMVPVETALHGEVLTRLIISRNWKSWLLATAVPGLLVGL